MTEEDFIAWRDQPMTRWFMQAFEISAEKCEREWHDFSWQTGKADAELLNELRAKAVTFAAVHEATFYDIKARHDEHERD